jgi:glycosyltransferase involved in cell wall biosynthesis
MKTISVVIPSYNEEENIRVVFDAVQEALSGRDLYTEVIFIDDGSSDGTLAAIKKLEPCPKCGVKYISFSRNFGKESAIYAGLQHATGDYTVLIDADMQQDPALIPDMIDVVENDPDCDSVVYYQEQRRESAFMRFMKKHFYKVINSISDVELKADASDFRLFRRNVVDAVLSLTEVNRFSKGIFSWVGFHTTYLPYVPKERNSGKSKWSFGSLVKYAISGITSFSVAPLKIATILGAVMAAFAFIYLAIVVIQKIAFGIGVPGFPTLAGLILLNGGLMMLFMGILGEYIAKTFIETKDRPVYIVREENEKTDSSL